MSKFEHNQLANFAQPASDTEELKMENARNAILKALNTSNILKHNEYEVFGQGSYANNTNIRNNSDVDINVCYHGAFYYTLPENTTAQEMGLLEPPTYTYSKYKDDIVKMLVDYFGSTNVERKNKCIHVKGNSYRTDIDVVPTWKHRLFTSKLGSYKEGVRLISDSHENVDNYPKQHLQNGIIKNNSTFHRYKKLVRIVKVLKTKMENEKYYENQNITSFLIEALVYNYPNNKLISNQFSLDWNAILRNFIFYFWDGCSEQNDAWKYWHEPSECLYLMYNHKWDKDIVREFMYKLWNYLKYS